MLISTPPKMKGHPQSQSYPQTPVLKGSAAVSNAISNMGTCLLAAGRVVLGAMCFVDPTTAANTYGLPPVAGWVQATGVRDMVIGITTICLFVTYRPSLRVWLPLCALIPLGDAYVVVAFADANTRSNQCMVHLFAAALLMFLTACIWNDPLVMPRMVLGRPISESV